jgi:hypothetical protein
LRRGQLRVDQTLRAEQPLDQLLLRHLEREDGDPDRMLDGRVLHDVQRERGLTHRGTARDDHEVAALQPRREAIEIQEPRCHARERAVAGMELLDPLHRRPDQLLQAYELFRTPQLSHLEHAVLGVVEHLGGGAATLVGILDDRRGGLDQPPQHRLVTHDPRVVLDVRRGRHHVDQPAQVLHPAGPVEIAAAQQLIAQRHGVDHIAALGERHHGAEQEAVSLAVEHRVVDQLGGLQGRVLVEQHRAEHRLLGLVAPRSLAAGELALSR